MNCCKYIKALTYILLISINCFFSVSGFAEETGRRVISGIVKNSKNKKPIENVSISIPETNIATVTNADGYFTLKIPGKYIQNGLKAEQIGFQTLILPMEADRNDAEEVSIFLVPTGKVLKELLVLGGEPREIVRKALEKIPNNYSDKDNLFSGFYRETVKKGNRFINISEGFIEVLKKPYARRNTSGEKVRIKRGRNILSPKSSDTLSVKLSGGPAMPIVLDVVKNGDHLFTADEMDYFDFKMDSPAMIEDRMHYAIKFEPKITLSYPLHKGVIYIDNETLSISRVEFNLDVKDKGKVTRSILEKKPSGLNFKPLEVSGLVTYKNVDGKSYVNYISSTIRFKCDWKKRLFSSSYTTHAEMVMVDREEISDKHMKFSDSFGKGKIFTDQVERYWDEDFWKDYNIIEPTESLEKAVQKLKK